MTECAWNPETCPPHKSRSDSPFSDRILSGACLDRVLSQALPPPQTPPRTPDAFARFCQMQNSPRSFVDSPPRTP
eukprot:4817689-Pyramimonas_sp.AAC.1